MTKNNMFSRFGLMALVLMITATVACTSDVEPTPYDREDFTPIAGPPQFPIIFEGKYIVDGEPGPAGQTIYAEFIHGGSPRSRTFDGEYVQVVLGPVSEADLKHGVISFYLGTRDGDHVKAKETWEWNPVGSPTNQILDLNFERLP
ncbi:MAG: hypothetical protein QF676_01770 [Dehalococcoidia bacterium]|nr:hypothetical protein [Dehalococcoidia bacterium]MDP7261318.1 hypothetical protein [Dehalococcoidia bacterium]MDP7486294.1 hypothetical protein [Dehalococcoidia bacterium]